MAVFIFAPVAPQSIFKSQIAFMGVRRQKGKLPQVVKPYDYKPRYYEYAQSFTINYAALDSGGNAVAPQTLVQQITDYDFDLYEIKIAYTAGSLITIPKICCAIVPYDSVKNQLVSAPMLDIFWNGQPTSSGAAGAVYQNGSIVPPLLYPQQSAIRIDVYSKLTSAQLPITANFTFVGMNRIPC